MNSYILISFILVFFIPIVLWINNKKEKINIIHIYTLFVFIYFGVYSIIDVILNDISDYKITIVLFTHMLVFTSLLLLILYSKIAPLKNRENIELKKMIFVWNQVGISTSVILLLFICIVTIYVYVIYGVLGKAEVASLENRIPYYLTSIRYLIPSMSFTLCLVSTGIIFSGKREKRYIWVLILIISMLITMLYGRRAIFNVVIMQGLILTLSYGRSILNKRFFKSFILILISMFLISNLFQNYRHLVYYSSASYGNVEISNSNILEAAFDFDKTIENLKDRTAMWRFNYLISENHLDTDIERKYIAKVLIQSFKNAVPSFLIENKEVIDLDVLISNYVGIVVTDYPTSIFSLLEFDFGFSAIFIYVLFILLVLGISVKLISYTRRIPILYAFISCNTLLNLLNIENTYTSLIVMIRDNVLIFTLFICISIILNKKSKIR